MGVPKGKTSKANQRMNRAARYTLEGPGLATCPQCHAFRQPHHICAECGYYDGKTVISKEEEAKQ